MSVLIEKGHLKPLEPRPLPKNLPLSHDPVKSCAFHQQASHGTNSCFRLRHEIQDLFDKKAIAPPEDPKAVSNLLPDHNSLPMANHSPGQHVIPANEPDPFQFIPKSSCLTDIVEEIESSLDLDMWKIYETVLPTLVVRIRNLSLN